MRAKTAFMASAAAAAALVLVLLLRRYLRSSCTIAPSILGSEVQLKDIGDTRRREFAEAERLYFSLAEQQQTECRQSRRIGRQDDGGWDICFSPPQFDIRRSRPCVAFSFGINHVYEYDDQLAGEYNCSVYMYDPSMNVPDHRRNSSSWFFATGVSSRNETWPNGWKMRTLCGLIKEAGYADRVIDILKLDVEFSEWETFESALRDGCLRRVKQLLFETHTAEIRPGYCSNYIRFVDIFRGLFRLGFRVWKWHRNPISVLYKSSFTRQYRGCCYEHYLLNTAFLPKSEG